MTSGPSRALLIALGLLSAFGPLSMDLYLPGLPLLVDDLGASDSLGQATMSASMIGLAVGQLFLGPLSDRFGRRRPLLVGVAAFVLLSLVCAAAPSIELLLIARLAQGVAGSAGIVVARAVVRDVAEGESAARAFAMLAGILAIVPVVAPLGGGLLLNFTDWRGIFVALAVIGAALWMLTLLTVPDTLAAEHRHAGGVGEQLREMGRIARDPRFAVTTLALGFGCLGLFSYISMGSLVLQDEFGLSPQLFSVVMTVNALGILVGTQISRRIVGRLGVGRVALIFLSSAAVGAVLLLACALAGVPLGMLLVPLFLAISSHGAMMANVTALALERHARSAGAASALLGTTQFAFGALVPPVASLGGVSAVLMAGCMAGGVLIALVLLLAVRRAG